MSRLDTFLSEWFGPDGVEMGFEQYEYVELDEGQGVRRHG